MLQIQIDPYASQAQAPASLISPYVVQSTQLQPTFTSQQPNNLTTLNQNVRVKFYVYVYLLMYSTLSRTGVILPVDKLIFSVRSCNIFDVTIFIAVIKHFSSSGGAYIVRYVFREHVWK